MISMAWPFRTKERRQTIDRRNGGERTRLGELGQHPASPSQSSVTLSAAIGLSRILLAGLYREGMYDCTCA